MDETQSAWEMKNGKIRLPGMFTCGRCTGVETMYFQMIAHQSLLKSSPAAFTEATAFSLCCERELSFLAFCKCRAHNGNGRIDVQVHTHPCGRKHMHDILQIRDQHCPRKEGLSDLVGEVEPMEAPPPQVEACMLSHETLVSVLYIL